MVLFSLLGTILSAAHVLIHFICRTTLWGPQALHFLAVNDGTKV
jgi:hypothetical protein